eukprot:g2143.t1
MSAVDDNQVEEKDAQVFEEKQEVLDQDVAEVKMEEKDAEPQLDESKAESKEEGETTDMEAKEDGDKSESLTYSTGASFTQAKMEILQAVNESRKNQGLGDLLLDPEISLVADNACITIIKEEANAETLMASAEERYNNEMQIPPFAGVIKETIQKYETEVQDKVDDETEVLAKGMESIRRDWTQEEGTYYKEAMGKEHTHVGIGLLIQKSNVVVDLTFCNKSVNVNVVEAFGKDLFSGTIVENYDGSASIRLAGNIPTSTALVPCAGVLVTPSSKKVITPSWSIERKDDGDFSISFFDEENEFGPYWIQVLCCPQGDASEFLESGEDADMQAWLEGHQVMTALSVPVYRNRDDETTGATDQEEFLPISTEEEEKEQERIAEAKRKAEEEERERAYADKARELNEIIELLKQAQIDSKDLEDKNAKLQRQLAQYLANQRKQDSAKPQVKSADEALAEKSPEEARKRYLEVFESVKTLRETLASDTQRWALVTKEYTDKYDIKREKAENIRAKFVEFKKLIAAGAENSRTRMKIPTKEINAFQESEKLKELEMRKNRLLYIRLKRKLKSVETSLREKEQLAEGLHLIDFEQLKIENQEKLQFVQTEVKSSKAVLGELDITLNGERDKLTTLKRELLNLNKANEVLKAEQGFAQNKRLVRDFQVRARNLRVMRARVSDLQNEHHSLKERIAARMREQPQTDAGY